MSWAAPALLTWNLNYLAHLYLSDGSPESLLGNLLADFLKAPASSLGDPGLRKGVELHRKIDRYTDRHRVFFRSIDRISPVRRRAAPVLVDIFYDHFLARNWDRYAPVPLPEFLDRAHHLMSSRWDAVPEPVQPLLGRLMPVNWMTAYAAVDGIRCAIERLAARVRPDLGIAGGTEELEANYAGLEDDFAEFFVELEEFVESERGAKAW